MSGLVVLAIAVEVAHGVQMARIEPSTRGYITTHDPNPDEGVEVLCNDQYGGYLLPYLCLLRDGVWTRATTGTALTVEVLGWRISKKFVFKAKPAIQTNGDHG